VECGIVPDAGNDIAICKGDSLLIGDYQHQYITYSWTPALGLNRTDTSFVWAKPDTTTIYYIIATDISGASKIDSITITVNHCDTLFIDYPSLSILNSSFSIFPNPSDGEIIVEYTGDSLCNATFELYNIYGVKLIEEKINSKKQRINLHNLGNAVYLYQINNCNIIENRNKLIINK